MTVCRHCGVEIERRPNRDFPGREAWGTTAPEYQRIWLVCNPGGLPHEPLVDLRIVIAGLRAIRQDLQ